MWKFLSDMPHELSFAIIISGIIAIVIISLRGHLKAMYDKKSIELGPDGSINSKDENGHVTGRDTVTIMKRSCGDCILLLMSEREKHEFKIGQETNKILKTQMNFVEQKLMEMHSEFMKHIVVAIHVHVENYPGTVDKDPKNDLGADESIQYKLVYGLLKDVTLTIKDEIRRSLKENGFYYLDNSDFKDYINDRLAIISSMLNQYIRNIFPDRSNIIRSQEIINIIESQNEYFSKIFKDIYTFAQSAQRESDENIIEIKNQFKKWVDDFSSPPQKDIKV